MNYQKEYKGINYQLMAVPAQTKDPKDTYYFIMCELNHLSYRGAFDKNKALEFFQTAVDEFLCNRG